MWPLKSSRQVSLARESVLLDLNVDCVIHGKLVDQPFRLFDASQLSKVGLPPGRQNGFPAGCKPSLQISSRGTHAA